LKAKLVIPLIGYTYKHAMYYLKSHRRNILILIVFLIMGGLVAHYDPEMRHLIFLFVRALFRNFFN
jgi:hypothetical protein